MNILGKDYIFDRNEDQVLEWGLTVPYMNFENDRKRREDKVVLKPYIFWSARLQIPIVIPTWFVTDGASIPRLARPIIPKASQVRLPSLPHDFGYCTKTLGGKVPKGDWDLVLRDFCQLFGMSDIGSYAVYAAVKVGGRRAYNNTEKRVFLENQKRDWYIDRYYYLNLDRENGKYILH